MASAAALNHPKPGTEIERMDGGSGSSK